MTDAQGQLCPPSRDPDTAEAIERADSHAAVATPEWREVALIAVRWCAEVHGQFTTEEVWQRLLDQHPDLQPPDGRALGATMLRAQRLGWIRATDRMVPRKIRKRNATRVQLWEATL